MAIPGKRPFPELAKRVEIDSQDQDIGGHVGVSGTSGVVSGTSGVVSGTSGVVSGTSGV